MNGLEVLRRQADTDRDNGRLDEAARAYELLVEQSRVHRDLRLQMVAYQQLGVTYGMAGNFTEALVALKRAQTLASSQDDKLALGNIARDFGIVAIRQQKYTLAGISMHESVDYLRETSDRCGLGVSLAKWGYVCMLVGERNRARELLYEALHELDKLPESNCWFQRVTALLHLAEVWGHCWNWTEARTRLQEVERLLFAYAEGGNHWRWAEYYLLSSYIGVKAGDPRASGELRYASAKRYLEMLPETTQAEMRQRFQTDYVESILRI